MIQSKNDSNEAVATPTAGTPGRDMNLWRKMLKRLFADSAFEGLTSDANIAILEALEIGVLADGEVTEEELRMLRSDVWKLPWAWNQSDSEVEDLLAAARRRVDAIREDEERLLEYTEKLVERIPAGAVRDAVYEMMVELSFVDGAGDWERDILEVFRRAGGISQERSDALVAAIKQRVRFD